MSKDRPEADRPDAPDPPTVGTLCALFAQAWCDGRDPRIEDYLAGREGAERAALLRELLRLEVAFRARAGDRITPEEYRHRFPSDAELVEAIVKTPDSSDLCSTVDRAEPGSENGEFSCAVPPEGAGPDGPGADESVGGRGTVREQAGEPVEPAANDSEPVLPFHVGKYRADALLGKGTFGRVYVGWDKILQKRVAIKLPHPHLISRLEDIKAYLAEARIVARLDHANIVPIFFADGTKEFPFYTVSKFITGTTLAKRIQGDRLTPAEAAGLVAAVAEALHHAHLNGVFHRDVKPSNILLDDEGKPYLADFGLALREEDFGRGPAFAGTIPYMSPEQARGEGHRVDGRSDIFSLGVVLYELLAGKRPFQGATDEELLDQIIRAEPRPPRQIDDKVPAELERICLKALSKPVAQRFSVAKDMAEDLRRFLAAAGPAAPAPPSAQAPGVAPPPVSDVPPPTPDRSVRVVPKGLRSFDAGDTEFFLELLPGPRDREGIPEILRFWKAKVEATDADQTFTVGLLYGPSGCGKSSLVKAGLLPRLADHVTTLYVEATAGETEARLLRGLRKRYPALPADRGLAKSVAALRLGKGGGRGKKLLIVLDQFEQWLHARRGEENTELVRALRHCDGGRVQCLVLVRDDFWMAATWFLHELEVRLVEGENSAAVDLFDARHAKKVLTLFGRAFGSLPGSSVGLSAEQERFLDQAVAGLAADGKVIPVRLALFAEMVKGRDWLPATLKAVGGPEGVGEAFLEQAFGFQAPPGRRPHQKAARAVLKALLPEQGTDIRGSFRARGELLEASGCAGRPDQFEELLHVLDRELRLVSPSDPEGSDSESARGRTAEGRFYQLTHDYLVPSIRGWLTRKQKESVRGRAELRLAELAELWNARPENRQLPSWWEWARIRVLTRSGTWTPPQRKMMAKARRHHALRGAVLAASLALVGWGVWDLLDRRVARELRDRLLAAAPANVPAILKEMERHRRHLEPLLQEARQQAAASNDSKSLLRLWLALPPSEPGRGDYLYERLFDVDPQEFVTVRRESADYKEEYIPRLWDRLADREAEPGLRFRAACALAGYAPDDPRWQDYGAFVAERLAAENTLVLDAWRDTLLPVGHRLLPPLARLLREGGEGQRRIAAKLYQTYSDGQPDAFTRLEAELPGGGEPGGDAVSKVMLAKRQANIAAALAAMGRSEKVWPLLRFSADPTVRSYLVEQLGPGGADPQVLEDRLGLETDVTVRRALLLALGSYGLDQPPLADRDRLAPRLLRLYESDADAGVHAAAEWALRRWGRSAEIRKACGALATGRREGSRKWYVNKEGQTFVILSGVGRVSHSFAIASKEVTVEEYRRFHGGHEVEAGRPPVGDCPVNKVSWYEAAHYCNWLSEKEGIPEDQWCYVANQQGKYAEGMRLADDFRQRTGYRLPTEAEWDFAARAGTVTRWCCGEGDEGLVDQYAWSLHNSLTNSQPKNSPVGLLKPNDFGLFDMHGNVYEWCQDRYVQKPPPGPEAKQHGAGMLDVVADRDSRTARGGSFTDKIVEVGHARRTPVPPAHRLSEGIGFRPARTLHPTARGGATPTTE